MPEVTLAYLTERLELADQLRLGRTRMIEPQDLPGAYGRVVKAIDRVLSLTGSEAVLAGGWAVWRHGYVGRVTQDVDVAIAADDLDEFLRVAVLAGFDLLPTPPGRWPKLRHTDTQIEVDILPEGPGTPNRPAPTTIPHPRELGAEGASLRYIQLPSLVELKLAAGRARDESDVVELVRVNEGHIDAIREHLNDVHADYVAAFDCCVERARDQGVLES